MRLEDLRAELRPRSTWEAADLGVVMLRHWGLDVARAWIVVFVPLWAVLWYSLRESPGWAIFACWCLEPWGSKLILTVLSRALFGERQDLRAIMAAVPGLLLRRFFTTTLGPRLSLMGTLHLPVKLLEDLQRDQWPRRIRRLFAGQVLVALVVGAACFSLRLLLVLGALGLGWMLSRHPATGEALWWNALWEGHPPAWFWIVFPVLLFMATGVTQALHVASTFGIYLNRRIWLEGWDVEIRFRQLVGRVMGTE